MHWLLFIYLLLRLLHVSTLMCHLQGLSFILFFYKNLFARSKYIRVHLSTGQYKNCSWSTNLPAEHWLCEGSRCYPVRWWQVQQWKIVTKEKNTAAGGYRIRAECVLYPCELLKVRNCCVIGMYPCTVNVGEHRMLWFGQRSACAQLDKVTTQQFRTFSNSQG
jgi:hypothetical protein